MVQFQKKNMQCCNYGKKFIQLVWFYINGSFIWRQDSYQAWRLNTLFTINMKQLMTSDVTTDMKREKVLQIVYSCNEMWIRVNADRPNIVFVIRNSNNTKLCRICHNKHPHRYTLWFMSWCSAHNNHWLKILSFSNLPLWIWSWIKSISSELHTAFHVLYLHL